MSTSKVLSQIKINALIMLVRSGKITVDDIKDEDYKEAVKTALNKWFKVFYSLWGHSIQWGQLITMKGEH